MEAHGSVFAARLGLHVHVALRDGALVATRIAREPNAAPADAEARPLLARIAAHLEGRADGFRDVPLDLVAAGPFRERVLRTLRDEVPPGRTITYGALARRLGEPGAARAVGGAMASNPMPLVVPCHRVLASDGNLGSYSGEGGVATKRALLRIEGALAQRTLDVA